MSQWIYGPCPKCDSSDAFAHKEGDTFGQCFSCGKRSPLHGFNSSKVTIKEDYNMHSLADVANYDTRGFQERGIKKATAQFFDVKVSYSEDGSINSHFYPYTRDGEVVAYKQRILPKKFLIIGDFKDVQLFGQSKFSGGGRRVIVVEGELDALAIAQAQFDKYQKFYPVVSLPSASDTRAVLEQRDWLRSFDEVVLCLDDDEPGHKARDKVAKIVGFDKCKVAKLPEKDACDTLVKHSGTVLMDALFRATSYNPAGIVSGEAVWEAFQQRIATTSIPYPKCLEGLNDKLYGMREGEITLFTSGTGSGKSTVIKEIILHLLDKTSDKVGLVSLEESIGDSAQKFIYMHLKKNPSLEEVPQDELRSAFDAVFGNERLLLLDHQGSVGDASLLDKIEYLALRGCRYVVLDHITIAVSEGAGKLTGNEAVDSIMSGLLKITKKHNIWLGIISHLRKGEKPFEEGHLPSVDDIKGSGSIKQISFDIIAFARNMVAEDEDERNTIRLRVLKSRFSGKTGDCGTTSYDPKTGRLSYNRF